MQTEGELSSGRAGNSLPGQSARAAADRRTAGRHRAPPGATRPDVPTPAPNPAAPQYPPMLVHPKIDPVALQLGPIAIHWYGITYLVAFGLFMFLANLRLKHEPYRSIQGPGAWSRKDIEDMLFLGVLGVVLGGRIGYCLFYKPEFYLQNPLQILYVWQGGMSFHGGLL